MEKVPSEWFETAGNRGEDVRQIVSMVDAVIEFGMDYMTNGPGRTSDAEENRLLSIAHLCLKEFADKLHELLPEEDPNEGEG